MKSKCIFWVETSLTAIWAQMLPQFQTRLLDALTVYHSKTRGEWATSEQKPTYHTHINVSYYLLLSTQHKQLVIFLLCVFAIAVGLTSRHMSWQYSYHYYNPEFENSLISATVIQQFFLYMMNTLKT